MERHVRSVLTGALLDVSGSMQRSFDRQQAADAARYASKNKWVRSIFQVADQLVKHDVSPTNLVFLGGVGAESQPNVFDILASLEAGQRKMEELKRRKKELKDEANRKKQEYEDRIERLNRSAKQNVISEALSILENGGAPRVRKWATADMVDKHVDARTACIILDALETDSVFKHKVVHEFLPEECREFRVVSEVANSPLTKGLAAGAGLLGTLLTGGALPGLMGAAAAASSMVAEKQTKKATDSEVREVIRKCEADIQRTVERQAAGEKQKIENELRNLSAKPIALSPLSLISVSASGRAQQILHSSNETELTDKRITELIETIEPYIYGGTPLMQALETSVSILSSEQYETEYKLLFILSDGEPSDKSSCNEAKIRDKLKEHDTTVVSCFITDRDISDPKRLYSTFDSSWDGPAKSMFDMCSTVSTQKIPRTLFVRKGWTIDTENNETRLFFQINHPDLIDEVCDIAKSCVCSQEALSDVLSDVDLDLYINRANEGFEPQKQSKLTCYGVASATVMHLSMLRVVGRDGGYPDFFEVRDKIVAQFGENRANTVQVLQEVCPEYRLQCEEVDERAALEAVIAKRPLVATFRLTRAEWAKFKQFFKQNLKESQRHSHSGRPH